MTEKRLIRELAEKGYHPEDSPDETGKLDEDDMVELVKAAHDLRKASKSMRVRYKVVDSFVLLHFYFHYFYTFDTLMASSMVRVCKTVKSKAGWSTCHRT